MIGIDTDTAAIIAREGQYIAQTYKRPPFALVRGAGVHLYDADGGRYTDWVAGIAVNALGYADPLFDEAIRAQLDTGLIHVSNLYHTAPHTLVAEKLVGGCFADRVFFCNSGAEANEGAIKFARKFAREAGAPPTKTDIVTFTGGFHGRTIGALSVTPKAAYQAPFAPLMAGVKVAEFNDIESARALIDGDTCAVIVEPVQGEGGIHPARPEFLAGLRELCDEHGALLIFDEVQCGVGRTGHLWAHQSGDVTPDIMTTAKPLAGGLPVGAVLCTSAVADALAPGDHGSTFAGSPLVMAAALTVLDRVAQDDFLAHVRAVGAYLLEQLATLTHDAVVEVRGRGLMAALELNKPAAPVIERGYEHGLLLVNAGANVLRFVPPLIVERAHVDELIETLRIIIGD